MAPARGTALLIALAGVGPILVGVLLLAFAPSPSAAFGWFAYAPLQETRSTSAVVVLGLQQCVGAALIAVGALVVAAVAAYRLGRIRAALR